MVYVVVIVAAERVSYVIYISKLYALDTPKTDAWLLAQGNNDRAAPTAKFVGGADRAAPTTKIRSA